MFLLRKSDIARCPQHLCRSVSSYTHGITNIPVTRDAPSGGGIRMDNVTNTMKQGTEITTITTTTAKNVMRPLIDTSGTRKNRSPSYHRLCFKLDDDDDVTDTRDDSAGDHGRSDVHHHVSGTISINAEADETVRHEKLLKRIEPKKKYRVKELIGMINYYHHFIKPLPDDVIKRSSSSDLFAGCKIKFSKLLDPQLVSNPVVLIQRIESTLWLLRQGIDVKNVKVSGNMFNIDTLDLRLKMLKECGMKKLTYLNMDHVTSQKMFFRVTSMTHAERESFFGTISDPEGQIKYMINNINVISKEEKKKILDHVLPLTRIVSINSIKVAAINKFIEINNLNVVPMNVSKVFVEYLDLADAIKIIQTLSRDVNCRDNVTDVTDVVLNISSDTLKYLLETLPFLGTRHVSVFFNHPRFIHLIDSIKKVNELKSRQDLLQKIGFSLSNISSNYQIFFLSNQTLNERLTFWFNEMGQDVMTSTIGSLKLIVMYEIARKRYNLLPSVGIKNQTVSKLTNPYTYVYETYKPRYEKVIKEIAVILKMRYDELYPNMIHIGSDSVVTVENSLKVYEFLTKNAEFSTKILQQKSYILFYDYYKVITMYESRLIADENYDLVGDAVKIDLLCYHLTSFKDHFITYGINDGNKELIISDKDNQRN